MYERLGKRIFDAAVGGVALVLLSPLMVLTALLVRCLCGRPVLFRQVRPGLHGRPFVILKFRTMNEARDERGEPLPDGERLTSFGSWLRRNSLDELPELLNVVKGEMSLVGPRPLLMEYLDLYTPEQWKRHEVRPGITGWAQVHGRNATSWEQRLQLDVWYVDNVGLWLDVRILARTLWTVLKREGISAQDHSTMPVFRGSKR